MVESLRDSMKLQLSLELQSISNLFTIHYYLLLQEVVGQNGLALLRQSHGGCNSPLDCCQEPPFESILALSALTLFSPLRFCLVLQVLQKLVGQNGLEPSTSRLSVVCSSQLSYWPILVEISGIEPLTSCLQGRRSPSWAKPPNLSHLLTRYIFSVPSKLNNVNPL